MLTTIETSLETLPPKYRWCVEQFGPEGGRWQMAVAGTFCASGHLNEFKFADERDVVLFILRWS